MAERSELQPVLQNSTRFLCWINVGVQKVDNVPNLDPAVLNTTYPIAWWRGEFGVNEDAVGQVFGKYVS